MKNLFLQDTDYWLHKTKVFLHDPPDKSLHIPGHEERSNDLLAAIGMVNATLTKEEHLAADVIAANMDRATLPGYAGKDRFRDGSVDFCEQPEITHPTGEEAALKIELPVHFKESKQAVDQISKEMRDLLKEDMGEKADSGQGLSEKREYQGKEKSFAPIRFHYLFFLLRRRLVQKNTGQLGALWHRLPADTRLPDHSIWQHSALVSALASCTKASPQGKASLMVYSLTPVQDFVGRARKLRDYWVGSVLLSWLAFEGIKAIIHQLGADHILYPSLHGQPLVDGLLQEWNMEESWIGENNEKHGVASFPNKFVCLVPSGREQEIADAIKGAINGAWKELGDATLEFLEEKLKKSDPYIKKQFERQLGKYWEHQWAAVPLLDEGSQEEVEYLLHKDTINPVFEFLHQSKKLLTSKGIIKDQKSIQDEHTFYPPLDGGEGSLYSVSHRLIQAMLAAGKSQKVDHRVLEEGIKCDLFGEFEILHYKEQCGKNPKPSDDPFWKDLRNSFPQNSEFVKNERLCALALVKRLAHRVCKEKIPGHPLQRMFKKVESFPSSTEMAMTDWWQTLRKRAREEDEDSKETAEDLARFDWSRKSKRENEIHIFRNLAQWYHEINEPEQTKKTGYEIAPINRLNKEQKKAAKSIFRRHPVKEVHKYYAVLMMDGDKMGKLINGETLGSTWGSVLHPDLSLRLSGDFELEYKDFWAKWLNKARVISPAVHASISESLGDFSLLSVPLVIERYKGRLIYAGGDDVCAILPVSTVLDAARDISKAYRYSFVVMKKGQEPEPVQSQWKPEAADKLGVYLGKGKDISISAGIMIAHHKKPLGKVMRRAHELLNKAKTEGKRNGFVLELDKRSGGGRIFMANWEKVKGEDLTLLEHFLAIADDLQVSEQSAMSSSLAYRLSTFGEGLKALIDNHPEQLVPFITKQLDRSELGKKLPEGTREEKLIKIAEHVAALINSGNALSKDEKKDSLSLESLIIANFIGHCRAERSEIL